MKTHQFTIGQSVIATLGDGDEIAGTIVETRPQFGIFIVQTETGSRLHVLEKRLSPAEAAAKGWKRPVIPFSSANHVGPITASEASEIIGDDILSDCPPESRFFVCIDTLWYFELMGDGRFYVCISNYDWIVETKDEAISLVQAHYFV